MEKYRVCFWGGCGYYLSPVDVTACSDEEALEQAVAFIVRHNKAALFIEVEHVEEMARLQGFEVEDFENMAHLIYVDATMCGASRPVYVRGENLRIEEVA